MVRAPMLPHGLAGLDTGTPERTKGARSGAQTANRACGTRVAAGGRVSCTGPVFVLLDRRGLATTLSRLGGRTPQPSGAGTAVA